MKFYSPVYLVTAVFTVALMACAPSYQPDEGEKFFMSSLVGEPGIIGDPSFIFGPPPANLEKAWQATGIVALKGGDKYESSTGNGVFVRLENDDKLYVLTAKHIVYNVKTLKRKSPKGFFIINVTGKNGDYDNVKLLWLNLRALPKRLDEFNKNEDYLLIEVQGADVEAFAFKDGVFSLKHVENIERLDSSKLFSVGIKPSKGEAGHKRIYKFYQTDFMLERDEVTKLTGSDNALMTDMDSISGLSGSPVFYDQKGSLEIVGILVTGTKKTGCVVHSYPLCENGILLVNK